MEIDLNKKATRKIVENANPEDLIKVRAIITCPNGDYTKKFRNQFPRSQLELLEVSLKCLDWLTCVKCGELLNLTLEFDI
ncbi:MAG: hypothetical protein ACFFKA_03230 [Candidatus Thorarchaeota archaeon]